MLDIELEGLFVCGALRYHCWSNEHQVNIKCDWDSLWDIIAKLRILPMTDITRTHDLTLVPCRSRWTWSPPKQNNELLDKPNIPFTGISIMNFSYGFSLFLSLLSSSILLILITNTTKKMKNKKWARPTTMMCEMVMVRTKEGRRVKVAVVVW